jgi:hypothetical protein
MGSTSILEYQGIIMNVQEKLLDKVLAMSDFSSYEKRGFVEKALSAPVLGDTNIEIEKYKIDKMIEANLIQDRSHRQKTVERIVEALISKKATYAYIATLSFILLYKNSGHFWTWMMSQAK